MVGEVSPRSDSLTWLCSQMVLSLEMGRMSEFSFGELNFDGDEGLSCEMRQIPLVLGILNLSQFVLQHFVSKVACLKLDQKTSRKLVEALYSQVHASSTNHGVDSCLF